MNKSWLANACITALMTCTLALSGCQTRVGNTGLSLPSSLEPSAQGTYLNPPSAGDIIPAGVGSVLCFSKGGALAMARTGFFAPDCQSYTAAPALVVEAQEHLRLEEGGVWLLKSFYQEQPVWLPIPWHDWA